VLVAGEGEQVGDVLAAGVAVGLRQLVRLGPVDPALVGEEQQPVVRRRHEEVVDDVVLLELAPRDALAAALLRAVEVDLRALRVAGAGDRDDHRLLGDEVLGRHVAVVRDEAAARSSPYFSTISASSVSTISRWRSSLARIALYSSISPRSRRARRMLLALQRGEPAQLQVEDLVGLDLVDVEQLHQAVARLVGRRRAADQAITASSWSSALA
jgi:hypothetical protein